MHVISGCVGMMRALLPRLGALSGWPARPALHSHQVIAYKILVLLAGTLCIRMSYDLEQSTAGASTVEQGGPGAHKQARLQLTRSMLHVSRHPQRTPRGWPQFHRRTHRA